MSTEASTGEPCVSVVMPAYNHERFVAAAIDSVLAQTLADFELIVIDDGSTDRTGDIVRAYDDPRVRYYHQRNQDAYNALNRGMGLSRGRYISIINSDDVYMPTRLERLVQTCEQTPASCAFSRVVPIDDRGEPFADDEHPWKQWYRNQRDFYLETGDLYNGFLHGNYMVTTSNLFMTAELAAQVGEFCSFRYLHDYDYIFRILLAAEERTVYLHDEDLLCYRIHGGNTLSEAAITGREQDKHIIRKYLLARCPPESHRYVNTGIDRLIELELELIRVRAQLEAAARETAPAPGLGSRLLTRLLPARSRR